MSRLLNRSPNRMTAAAACRGTRSKPGPLTLIALGVLTAGAIASFEASAAYKCWTNKDGVRECGERVPPEYAQQGHVTLDDQGLTRSKTEAAPDKADLERLRAEQAAKEAEQAEAAKERARQEVADQALMNTFTTEDDLLKNRDARLSALDSRVEHSRQVIIKLDEGRRQLENKAAQLERGGEALPDTLKQRLASNLRQIRQSESSIADMLAEHAELEGRYSADLERFRKLKGIGSNGG